MSAMEPYFWLKECLPPLGIELEISRPVFNLLSYQAPKLFSCSTQLSMKFFLLINVKMPTTVGILTFMSRKNNILCLSEPEKC